MSSFNSFSLMHPDTGQTVRAKRFESALHSAGAEFGLDTSVIEPLRLHGSGLYLLPREGVVGRLVEATDENQQRACKALQLTAWLHGEGFPTVEPASDRLFETNRVLVSIWHYLPQPEVTEPLESLAKALGSLLRRLHHLPAPPFALPTVEPLARLRSAMRLDSERGEPILSDADRAFLGQRMAQAGRAYAALEFPLGHGLIHNDAHLGNLLRANHSPHGYVLTDWEGAAWGPREIDLIQRGAPGNRFRDSEELRSAFNTAYGHDVASWSGWRVLHDLRDLHSLAAYIRTAAINPAAHVELLLRIESLRTGDTSRPWTAVS